MKLVNNHKHMLILLLLSLGVQISYAQVTTLDQCVEIILENNKMIDLGRNGIEISKNKQAQLKTYLRPKVTIESDYKYFISLPHQLLPLSVFGGPEGQFKDAQFGVPHNINANVQVAIPLYNAQLKSGIESAKLGIEMAEAQKIKSEEKLIFEVTTLYFNAQVLLNQLLFIEQNIESSNTLFKTIDLLYQQSLLKKIDVDKVTVQILQLEASSGVVQGKYEQVLNGIKTLMGLPLESELMVDKEVVFQHSGEYTKRSTVDIQIMDVKNRLLEGELNIISKSKLPTVALFGSYGTTGYGYDESPNQFLDFYPIGFVGLKATYPLYSGGLTKKKENIKQIEIRNNRIKLSMLNDQTKLKIENAKLKVRTSMNSIIAFEEVLKHTQDIYSQTVILQKEGLANITDIITADIDTRDTQQKYLNSIIQYLRADLELKQWTGNITK